MIDFFEDTNPYVRHYNDNNLLGINSYDNSIILDFFDMASYICYTDFYTKRQEDLDNQEKLTVTIPVNNLKEFNTIKEKIEALLTYMTNGERWTIKFIKQRRKKKIERTQMSLIMEEYNSVALLSGGLDSMAGTNIEKSNKTIFVTYSSNFIESNNASDVYEKLVKSDKNTHVVIEKVNTEVEAHYTERTRSLIFIASCLLYADYYNIPTIKIYENGIMSLNPKFNFSRRVTKTTNQKTLYIINEILKTLNININVENPFKYKTKKEVIDLVSENYYQMVKKRDKNLLKKFCYSSFQK